MADNLKNGQTCLEKISIEERAVEMVRSDYNAETLIAMHIKMHYQMATR